MKSWQPLKPIASEALRDARLELHAAAVLLASVAGSILPARSDDSHSNLAWIADPMGFATRNLGSDTDAHHLALAGKEQSLRWMHGDQRLAELSLPGRTLRDGLEWAEQVARGALSRGVDIAERRYPDMPAIDALEGGAFHRAETAALETLLAWYANAQRLMTTLGTRDPALSEIRVWPHHFDLGALLPIRNPDVSIGLGMSPGDPLSEAPYFYCAPYPQPDSTTLLPALRVGAWQRASAAPVMAWLRAEEILAAKDHEEHARAYLRDAVDVCRGLLA